MFFDLPWCDFFLLWTHGHSFLVDNLSLALFQELFSFIRGFFLLLEGSPPWPFLKIQMLSFYVGFLWFSRSKFLTDSVNLLTFENDQHVLLKDNAQVGMLRSVLTVK